MLPLARPHMKKLGAKREPTRLPSLKHFTIARPTAASRRLSAPPSSPDLGRYTTPPPVRAAVRAVRNRGRGLKEAEAWVDKALEEEAGHLRRQPPLVRLHLPRKRHPQPRPRAPLVGLCRPPAAPRLEVRQHVPHDLQRPANWPLPGKPPKAVHRDAPELVPVVVLQLP